MEWIRSWFTREIKKDGPFIRFGRFSDSYKTKSQYDAWDEAQSFFDSGDTVNAFLSFLRYLSDPDEDNIEYEYRDKKLHFKIRQGSIYIKGTCTAKNIEATAFIATIEELEYSSLSRYLEENFHLNYSRYSITEHNELLIKLDCSSNDASPYYLYYGLKEMALKADKQDDLIVAKNLAVNEHTRHQLDFIPDKESAVKYEFLIGKIQDILSLLTLNDPSNEIASGAAIYVLLGLVYKLDYLVKPEGTGMEILEKCHRIYFDEYGLEVIQKQQLIIEELTKLSSFSYENFRNELYHVKYTFGVTRPTNHTRLASFINGELQHIDWYISQNLVEIALGITDYIVGYILFNFSPSPLDKKLLHLYYEIIECEFFNSLGFTEKFYDTDREKFERKAIREKILEYQEDSAQVNIPIEVLNFGDRVNFAKSYLKMVSLAGKSTIL